MRRAAFIVLLVAGAAWAQASRVRIGPAPRPPRAAPNDALLRMLSQGSDAGFVDLLQDKTGDITATLPRPSPTDAGAVGTIARPRSPR
jgi:hypothetical protein